MSFFSTALGVLFPDACVGCGAGGGLLCAECAHKLPPAPNAEHDFIMSIHAYRDFRVRALVRKLKYKNTRHAAEVFGPALAGKLVEFLGEEGAFLGTGAILLVPVPLSKKRERTRGYNQAEVLAKAAMRHLPKGTAVLEPRLLEKILETGQQADIKKRAERLANLGDCFRAARRPVGGETIILVDDVSTTGATLLAARKALRAAGYGKVFAITAAH